MVRRIGAVRMLCVAVVAAHVFSGAIPLNAQTIQPQIISIATLALPPGDAPSGIVVNPTTNRLYVADGGSATSPGTVWVFDAATTQLITTISTAVTGYKAIAINTRSNKIYVGNQQGGSVTVIDGATNSVIRKVVVPGCPTGIDVNPYTNRIYVSSQCIGPDNMYVIDGSSDTLTTAVIPLGGVASQVVVDPVDNLVFASVGTLVGTGGTTAVIDGRTSRIIKTSTALRVDAVDSYGGWLYGPPVTASAGALVFMRSDFSSPVAIPIDAQFGIIYGAAVDPGTQLVYAVTTGSTPTLIIIGQRDETRLFIPLSVQPVGSVAIIAEKRLFVLNANRTVSVFSLASDVITIGDAVANSSTVSVPIYLRDVPATPLGMDNSARFSGELRGIAADAAGNGYLADTGNASIRKISPDGVVTTIAGTPAGVDDGDGGSAAAAHFLQPEGVAIDAALNVFVSDYLANRVRKISLASGLISAFAGSGAAGFSGDGGPATASSLTGPRGVAVDHAGNVYIGDSGNARVRRVSNGIIATIAGNSIRGSSGDGGPATAASIIADALALDNSGNLFVAALQQATIRRIAVAPGTISSFFLVPASLIDVLSFPGITTDSFGNVYVPNRYASTPPDGGVIEKITSAGLGAPYVGSGGNGAIVDGPASQAQFARPYGISADGSNNLLVSEETASVVRKITPSADVSTIAGVPYRTGFTDGGPLPRISSFSFILHFSDPSKIAGCTDATSACQVTFQPAGVLAGKTPRVQNVARTTDGIAVLYSYDPVAMPLTFTSNAAPPGDLIGYLNVTLAPNVVNGDHITISNVTATGGEIDYPILRSDSAVEGDPDVILKPGTITVSRCTVALVKPNGGETWLKGTQQNIIWTTSGGCGATLSIELLKSGALYDTITSAANEASNSFSYTVPSTYADGNDYQIRIRDSATATSATATSSGFFSILTPPPSCPPMNAGNTFISYFGTTSGCAPFVDSCRAGEGITFQVGFFNYDESCSTHSYSWDFGDGTSHASGKAVTHVYVNAGAYNVKVFVQDGTGQTFTALITVKLNDRFAAGFTYAFIPGVLNGVIFTPSVTPPPPPVTSVSWNFGDGSTDTTTKLIQEAHVFAASGTYVVTLTIQLADGSTVSSTQTVSTVPGRHRSVHH